MSKLNEMFNDFFNQPFRRKSIQKSLGAGHKYIKRTGSPGHYRYWYKNPATGQIYSDSDPSGKNSGAAEDTKSKGTQSAVIGLPKITVAKKSGTPHEYRQGVSGSGHHITPNKDQFSKILHGGQYSIISAGRNINDANDKKISDSDIIQRHLKLESDIKKKGYKYTKIVGLGNGKEDSFMVHDAHPKDINELGIKYNQNSVIHSDGNRHLKLFITGKDKGQALYGEGHEDKPESQDNHIEITHNNGEKTKFSLNFNQDALQPATSIIPELQAPANVQGWQRHPSDKGLFLKESGQTISYEQTKDGKYNLFHNGDKINQVPYQNQEHALSGFAQYLEQNPSLKVKSQGKKDA